MPFDPPFPIDHLHEGERNRIRNGDLNPREQEMLAKGEDPWRKFRGPEKQPPSKPPAGAEEWYSDDPNDVSLLTGQRKRFTALRIPATKPKEKKPEQEQLPLSTGTRVPGQRSDSAIEQERREREQKQIEAEVVATMHPTHREKYSDLGTPENQRQAIFATYKEKLDERKRRDEAEFRKRLAQIAEAQDLLQRIKGDPSKAHVPLPADDSEEELLKWRHEMSKPVQTVPHANPSEQWIRRDRMWRDIQATGRADPKDIAEEEAEALRYKLQVQEARERKFREVQAEFAPKPIASLEARETVQPTAPSVVQQRDRETEKPEQRPSTALEKFDKLAERNSFMGGGIGMAIAAYAFLLSGAPALA